MLNVGKFVAVGDLVMNRCEGREKILNFHSDSDRSLSQVELNTEVPCGYLTHYDEGK